MNSWDVVRGLNLVVEKAEGVLLYGSSDPMPNPSELLLTQEVAAILGSDWRFFVYRHGKNIPIVVPKDYVNPPGVFDLETIIPQDLNLRDVATKVFQLRREPVVVAHRSDGRPIRATTREKEVPDIKIHELHASGGWLGGSAIHYILRLYAEKNRNILYICPFQTKGRVYEIYAGMGRKLFCLTPFVRIAPPPRLAPQGWEPLDWNLWRALPRSARHTARLIIKEVLKEFFRRGEPRRIEIPWGWWEG